MKGYGQFCPVAKAVEIVGERWTILVLREIICGSSRFNDIRKGVPLMSPSLLSKRLKELEKFGVIERIVSKGSRATEYRATAAGEEMRPIIIALGLWGQRWVEDRLVSEELDAGVLMWDMRRRIDSAKLPDRRIVLHFLYPDAPTVMQQWWIVIDDHGIDLCYGDPGHEVDLFFTSSLRAMIEVWMGHVELKKSIASGAIEIIGERALINTMPSWFQLNTLVEAARMPDQGSLPVEHRP